MGHARGVDIGEVVEDDEHRQGQPGDVEELPELARGSPWMDECEAEGKRGEKGEEEAGRAIVDAEADRADEENEGDGEQSESDVAKLWSREGLKHRPSYR